MYLFLIQALFGNSVFRRKRSAAQIKTNIFYLRCKRGYGCFFLLLRIRADNYALGEQLYGAAMLFSVGIIMTLTGLILIGLGCAPIYPCIIHATPDHFGADKSQALIGVQMASAYVGTSLMPPLFGVIANYISISLMPIYLLAILLLMVIMHERLVKKTLHINNQVNF